MAIVRAFVTSVTWALRRPLSAVIAWATFTALFGVWLVVSAFVAPEAVSALAAAASGTAADGFSSLPISQIAGVLGLGLVIRWLWAAGVWRAMAPSASGFIPPIGLGGHEARYGVAMLAAFCVCLIPAGALAGAGALWAAETGVAPITVWAGGVGVALALIFAVRFSLIGPAGAERGDLGLLGSWTATLGAFWAVLLVHALTLAVVIGLGYASWSVGAVAPVLSGLNALAAGDLAAALPTVVATAATLGLVAVWTFGVRAGLYAVFGASPSPEADPAGHPVSGSEARA